MEMKDRHDAYTAMLSRHRHVIWAMCRDHAHGKWDDCCDLVQEVSLRLWIEFDKLRPDASPKEEREWVRWVTRKVFFLENRKRRLSTVTLTREAVAVPASDEEMRYREYVEEMMAALSPEEQRLLSLKMEGYNADEIASIMGLKRDAVYQRMHRIALKARKVLVVVLLLIGTSTVAIAVVPQWRQAVFAVGRQEAPTETAPPTEVPVPSGHAGNVQPPAADLPATADTIVELPCRPCDSVPHLQPIPFFSDTVLPSPTERRGLHPVITVNGSTVMVRNAEGEMVRVYNAKGTLVAMKRCHGSCRIDLVPSHDELSEPLHDYLIQVGDSFDNLWRLRWRKDSRHEFFF